MKNLNTFEEFVNETKAVPGEWVSYIDVHKSARAAKMWLNKNSAKYLSDDKINGIGIMPKIEWDSTEAKYAL